MDLNIQKNKVAIIGINDQETLNLLSEKNELETFPYIIDSFLIEGEAMKKSLQAGTVIFYDNITEELEQLEVETVLINIAYFSRRDIFDILSSCIYNGKKVIKIDITPFEKSSFPPIINFSPIKIEDLFHENLPNNFNLLKEEYFNKTILITGGAGSIGKGLVLNLSKYKPKLLVIIDHSESDLWELELELKKTDGETKFEFELLDIRDKNRLQNVFDQYGFNIVFHTAAYKQVPLLERNLYEAINVNLLATIELVHLANQFNVEKFNFLSTDKAVNPSSIMGLTKRASEVYIKSFNKEKSTTTKFFISRLGNVIGSKGSVVPFFERQINENINLTVTDTQVERYFISNLNACQLLLEVLNLKDREETFVFDMGYSIKILEIAQLMLLIFNKNLDIKIIGLRKGEKLMESLISDKETLGETANARINRVIGEDRGFEEINKIISELIIVNKSIDNRESLKLVQQLVPEYKKTSINELS